MRRVPAWLAWIALLLVALGARLAAVAVVRDLPAPWSWEVEVMARSLVETGVLAYDFYGLTALEPTAFLPPVYPLYVAAMWAISGVEYQSLLVASQVVLSTASVALLVPVAARLTRSAAAGWLAGFGAAVYPAFVLGAVQINTVTLEVLFIILFGWCILAWADRPRYLWLGLAGLTLGLLALTRGPALLLWPVVGLWLLAVYPARALHRRIAWLAVFTICLLLPMLPWAARNAQAIGAPIAIASNGGLNFWIGHNPAADGEYAWPLETDRALAERAARLSEPERDRLYYGLGLSYLQAHPAEEVSLTLRKLWYFLWFRPGLGSSYPTAGGLQALAQFALIASYGVVLAGALLGLWACRRDWRRLFVLYGIWPAYAVSAVVYFTATRFRVPVEPYLLAFAGAGIVWLVLRGRALAQKETLTPSTPRQAWEPSRE